MNVQVIKNLIEKYSIDQLNKAEEELLEEMPLSIPVDGTDDGERLTHILAAVFCLQEMHNNGANINQAIRLYSQRVRNSIA